MFRPGDEILSIGSKPVADQLDVHFRAEGTGSERVTIRRGTRTLSRVITKRAFARARLVFEEMRFTRCRSKCIFCFMDQMPPGLRESLYDKDDDYRLSFLFGNFITLNDLHEQDIRRIIELRLSPLYISVHALAARVRERIFGRPMRRDVMKDMKRLARAGITMHAQIVLVPGVNDGAALEKTVRKLFGLYPGCRSVAVVPVGLTRHRRGLPPLRCVSDKESRRLIAWAERERERLRAITGRDHFLHCADEFYLAAKRKLPPEDAYDDFPQLGNGVGMCRFFLKMLEADIARVRNRTRFKTKMTIATGTLGARFMRRYVLPLLERHAPSLAPRILVVRNHFFGRTVSVSGLLSGADIVRASRENRVSGCLVVPSNALNHRGFFLDGLRPSNVAGELGLPVLVARSTFLESGILKRCSEVAR